MTSENQPAKKRDPNNPCLFCKDARGVSLRNELAYSARDSYAVSPGHTLVIPRRHVASFFDLTPEEINACMGLITEERKLLDAEFNPDGYNIGVNVGPAAGQSIFHVHIHIIPRYKGDVENPQGGVRHVIPKKGHYTRQSMFVSFKWEGLTPVSISSRFNLYQGVNYERCTES